MSADVRENLEKVLPTVVENFELVSNTIPTMKAEGLSMSIWGTFVGQCAGESIEEALDPDVLAERLRAFIGQRLYAVEGGRGWVHLDFTNGWIRVVADREGWEGWIMSLPGVSWDGWWDRDSLESSRVTGRDY